MKRLCLVVSTAPECGELDRVLELATCANQSDLDVSLFVMDQAVAGLPSRRQHIAQLVDDGCEVAVCAQSAGELGLAEADIGVELGGQDDHAAMVSRADCTLAFT